MGVLVTGANGQLGYDVCRILEQRNIDFLPTTRKQLDITNTGAVEKVMRQYHPDAVIHCAAYTAVDKAEDDRERCWRVNVEGTRNVAKMCKEIGAKMLYLSTDYVFSGTGIVPYNVDDETGPLCVYGQTKLEGENIVQQMLDRYYIVRVSWIFGKNGNNFVKTMLRLGKEQNTVTVVDDQIGSPTYTVDLAALLCDMVASERYGVYHATNEGYCSWAEFAEYIFSCAGYATTVKHICAKNYPTKAARPNNSRLSKEHLDKSGFKRLPEWNDAVNRFLSNLEEQTNDKLFSDF